MAGRDIQIPFGPDKTGGIGLASLSLPEIEPDDTENDPFAEPPASKYARPNQENARPAGQGFQNSAWGESWNAPQDALQPMSHAEVQQVQAQASRQRAAQESATPRQTPKRAMRDAKKRSQTSLPVRSFGEPASPAEDEPIVIPTRTAEPAPSANAEPSGQTRATQTQASRMPADQAAPVSDPNPENVYDNTDDYRQYETQSLAIENDYDEELDDDYEYRAGGLSEDEVVEQGYDDMQMSFLALKDSVGKGRELKARERELQEFADQLDADREELADREDILLNYRVIVDEQEEIIDTNTRRREAYKAELAQLTSNIAETTEALERMREDLTSQMGPLETELGRARATADQAKNDERSRKSELNAAESEMKRAASGNDATMASARLEQVRKAYEDAKAYSERAKDELAEVQRIYDDAIAEIEQREGPLERSIADMEAREEELKRLIGELGEEISVARKRRQFCDAVYQYPDETKRLRENVEADERTLREMELENDELRNDLAYSKQQARKAKLALGIVALIVIIFLIALIIVLVRG